MVSLRFGTFSGVGQNLGVLPVLLPRLRARLVPWIEAGRAPLPLIPKGNFYYHFRSKDDVLRAVVEARRTDVAERLSEWRAEHASPEQPLRRVVAMLVNEEDKLVRFRLPHPPAGNSRDSRLARRAHEPFSQNDQEMKYARINFIVGCGGLILAVV